MDDLAYSNLSMGVGIPCGGNHDFLLRCIYDLQWDFHTGFLYRRQSAKYSDENLFDYKRDLCGLWGYGVWDDVIDAACVETKKLPPCRYAYSERQFQILHQLGANILLLFPFLFFHRPPCLTKLHIFK